MEQHRQEEAELLPKDWTKIREFLARTKRTVSAKILWNTGHLRTFFPTLEIPEKGMWSVEVNESKDGRREVLVYSFDAFGKIQDCKRERSTIRLCPYSSTKFRSGKSIRKRKERIPDPTGWLSNLGHVSAACFRPFRSGQAKEHREFSK
jgi:hypothetical protein